MCFLIWLIDLYHNPVIQVRVWGNISQFCSTLTLQVKFHSKKYLVTRILLYSWLLFSVGNLAFLEKNSVWIAYHSFLKCPAKLGSHRSWWDPKLNQTQEFLRDNSNLQKVSEADCYLAQPYLIRTFYLGKKFGGRVRGLSGCLEEGVVVR